MESIILPNWDEVNYGRIPVPIPLFFRTLLSKKEEWEREYTDYNLKENIIKWYTDGSKTSTGAAGIYEPSAECALSLGSYMSVFQTEILAICQDINLEINYQVFLTWVAGHSGIKGNEEANTLAKEGARMSLIGPEPFCGIGKCTYKEFLEKEKVEKEKLCRNLPGMEHFSKFLLET